MKTADGDFDVVARLAVHPQQALALVATIACVLHATQPHAQVITDGSLGAATSVSGPNFLIDDALGQTRGSNLFHSFSTFNISAIQSATFDSTSQISNIIARVTGPAASTIRGQLNANANLFLLNPHGVILSSELPLNVSGSLHISTADYLRLGSGERFYASLGPASVLSFSAPTAFGFLDGPLGSISVTGSGLEWPGENRAISLVAGNISLNGASISLERGRLNLAAVGSPGEVVFSANTLDTSAFSAMGTLRVTNTVVNGYDETGTSVFIRAGQFVIENNSLIGSTTEHASHQAAIDIATDTIELRSAGIATQALGSGAGPDLNIRANRVQISESSAIFAGSAGAGIGGDVTIDAREVTMSGGFSLLGTGTVSGSGGAGNLTIRAQSIDLADGGLSALTAGPARGGDIHLIADNITLRNSVAVTSGSSGGGNAGSIAIDVDTLQLRNAHITSSTAGSGNGGVVTIEAATAHLGQGASITSETGVVGANGPAPSYGSGGAVVLDVDSLRVDSGSRISASTLANGVGGSISIRGLDVAIDGSAVVSARSTGTGNAGAISIVGTEALDILDGAQITAEAQRASGGNIVLASDANVRIRNSSVATSVLGGTADGGNIVIGAALLLLDDSSLAARAISGSGGRIDLTSDFIVRSANSTLDASSALGIDGEVVIGGAELDLNSEIAPLPADFIDAHRWLAQPCASRLGTNVSQLVVAGRDGAYRAPHDLAGSPLMFEDDASSDSRSGDVPLAATELLAGLAPACK